MCCLFSQTSDGRSGRRRPGSQLHGSNKWILNGKKLYCYLFGSNTAVPCVERKKVPKVFIIIITHHLLLKVEVALEKVQTAGYLAFFPQKYVCF